MLGLFRFYYVIFLRNSCICKYVHKLIMQRLNYAISYIPFNVTMIRILQCGKFLYLLMLQCYIFNPLHVTMVRIIQCGSFLH